MSSFRSAILKSGLALSVAMAASASAYGSTAKIIFSAENALYGSGYDIGKADGWMDDSLRAAISRFQSRQKLTATGVLDAQTLKALGVDAPNNKTISGNDVSSPAAALAQIGYSKPAKAAVAPSIPAPQPIAEEKKKPEVKEQKVAAPQPKPAPKPAPKPVAQVEKKVEVKPAPPKKVAKPVEAKPQPVAKVEAKPAARPAPEPKPVVAAPAPKVEAKKTAAPTPVQPAESQTDESVSVASQSRYELKADGTQSSLEKLGVITGNPVASASSADSQASANSAAAQETSERESSGSGVGNFFSNLFDFLFGWIV